MQWKQDLVTGIFRKGSKSGPANYRPVSLTCLCCKIMEHTILSHIAKYLSANDILLDSQHGFCEKLSSVTQLISSCHDWTTTIQSRGQVDVVFLDFNKAFDKVPHHRLSVKLSYHGINGSTLTWIDDFLRNRVHAVSLNGSHSTWGNVTSRVPQGSVLGPALFPLYIYDIKEKIQSNMCLYADDTIVYREISSINDHGILHRHLDIVCMLTTQLCTERSILSMIMASSSGILTLSEWTTTWLLDFCICKVPSFRLPRSVI